MQGICYVLAVKNAALDVAICKYRGFFAYLVLRHSAHKIQVSSPLRLARPLKLPYDERRDVGSVIGKLVLPPSDGQVASKRLVVVEIGADHRRFQIQCL